MKYALAATVLFLFGTLAWVGFEIRMFSNDEVPHAQPVASTSTLPAVSSATTTPSSPSLRSDDSAIVPTLQQGTELFAVSDSIVVSNEASTTGCSLQQFSILKNGRALVSKKSAPNVACSFSVSKYPVSTTSAFLLLRALYRPSVAATTSQEVLFVYALQLKSDKILFLKSFTYPNSSTDTGAVVRVQSGSLTIGHYGQCQRVHISGQVERTANACDE